MKLGVRTYEDTLSKSVSSLHSLTYLLTLEYISTSLVSTTLAAIFTSAHSACFSRHCASAEGGCVFGYLTVCLFVRLSARLLQKF